MALGVSIVSRERAGHSTRVVVDLTPDTSYASGGWALPLSKLGVSRLDTFHADPVGGYVPTYDTTNHKLQVFYGDYNNASDGPLIENATADITGAVTKFRAIVTGV